MEECPSSLIPEKREPTREERIEAKVAAISAQTPKRPKEEIFAQAMREVDRGLEVWGSVGYGLKWYTIEGEGKEKMEEWQGQIEAIRSELSRALQSGDFTSAAQIMGEKFHPGDLKRIVGKIQAESERYGVHFDDEAQQLMSMGLWLWREQGREWAGHPAVLWKTLTKDSVRLSSFLERNGAPSCIDTSYLFKAMADQAGIQGDVKKIEDGGIPHRYFKTESGKILDYWWSGSTAGLKLNEQAFEDSRQKASTRLKAFCGA